GHADAVGQARFDVHVHVFQIDAPVEGAGFDLSLNVLQVGDDLVALVGAQHAGLFQHGGVGDGAHDVVTVEALVELDGGGESGDEGVDGLAEAAAPGLVGLVGAHECARRKRGCKGVNDNRVGAALGGAANSELRSIS